MWPPGDVAATAQRTTVKAPATRTEPKNILGGALSPMGTETEWPPLHPCGCREPRLLRCLGWTTHVLHTQPNPPLRREQWPGRDQGRGIRDPSRLGQPPDAPTTPGLRNTRAPPPLVPALSLSSNLGAIPGETRTHAPGERNHVRISRGPPSYVDKTGQWEYRGRAPLRASIRCTRGPDWRGFAPTETSEGACHPSRCDWWSA